MFPEALKKLWKSFNEFKNDSKLQKKGWKYSEKGQKLTKTLTDAQWHSFLLLWKKNAKSSSIKAKMVQMFDKATFVVDREQIVLHETFFCWPLPRARRTLARPKRSDELWLISINIYKSSGVFFYLQKWFFFQSAFHISRPYAFSIAWVVRPLICEN